MSNNKSVDAESQWIESLFFSLLNVSVIYLGLKTIQLCLFL